MIRTVVGFRAATNACSAEAEACAWPLNESLNYKSDFCIDGSVELKLYCKGRNGVVPFPRLGRHVCRPIKFDNNWCAETCLNEDKKVSRKSLIAQTIGLGSEVDYDWQSDGREKEILKDVSTLLRELENLPNRLCDSEC